jgi:glycosyltransferase involved in cell wall biosynthesis
MNKKQPLVSIVTPSYNQGKYLEATILSVLEQDYPDIQYFIMDGGSTDESIEVIHKYERRLAGWVSEKDKGQTDAINKGFNHADGEILAWLNSDDTYQPGAISEAVGILNSNPDVGMVYGDANFINETGKVIGRFPAAQTDIKKLRRGYVHIPQQASFWRADLWKTVGPLDPSFYFAMDYDLWVRLACITRLLYIPNRVWANFRLHATGKSYLSDSRCWPEMLKVHYRDGGTWFSIIQAKYMIRKMVTPLWRMRIQQRMGRQG